MKPNTAAQAGKAAEEAHKQVYGEAGAEVPPAETSPGEVPPADSAFVPPSAARIEDPREETVEYWKQKFSTLRGMFNADIPRLNAELRELREKNTGLEQVIAQLQAAPPRPPVQPGSHITEEDIQDYGNDLVDLARRAARDALDTEIQQLRAQNAELRQQSLQFQQVAGNFNAERVKTARQTVHDALNTRLPDWQMINREPEFLDWLAEVDAFSGETRQTMLNQAYESNDAPRVVAFFMKYVTDKQTVTGQAGNQTTRSPTVSLDSLVAPGRATNVGTPPVTDSQANARIWTSAEVRKFYHDVQRGLFKNNPAEKSRIESLIIKAGNEGRIAP